MAARHAVVSGGSIAGLSVAWWLTRTGWRVTLVERADAFRDGGQNVDVRGVAHEVLDRMGLTDAVAAQNTTETGTVLVNEDGSVLAELPSEGPDGATAELEVLRGDFARTILDALPEGVEMVYGDVVEAVDEKTDHVVARLASGRTLVADLLVVAEGVRSSTRDLLFDDVDTRELGITMAFGTIPRASRDDSTWRWLTNVGGRQVHLRPDNHGTTRAILAYAGDDDLVSLERADALRRLHEVYGDVGWEAPRVLDGFDGSDDLYLDRLTQVRMPTWHRGRVVLAGDAGWCVTPMGGGGASLALTSGYVLAAYLSSHGPDDVEGALAAYEEWMRPLVDDVQSLPPGIDKLAYPRTALGLKLHDLVVKATTRPPLSKLASKVTQVAQTDQELPPLHATVA
jgi:2-polyprenyl-6-methoxyphenol hydroxylase-like FAD-dependent oxidoreductase